MIADYFTALMFDSHGMYVSSLLIALCVLDSYRLLL